jgi:DnaA family protein
LSEQLVFALVEPEPPTFANYVTGRNAEVVAALAAAASGGAGDPIALWGVEGAGKSHLLQAFVAAAHGAGRRARFVAATSAPASSEGVQAIGVDDIDQADPPAQARLFTLYNDMRAHGAQWCSATREPAARSAIRDDLRTRLGWGLTFEVRALADADKPAALLAHARQRGLRLSDDVVAYLLAHGRRDMRSLTSALAALDRHSLATHRAITVALLREWMTSTRLPL